MNCLDGLEELEELVWGDEKLIQLNHDISKELVSKYVGWLLGGDKRVNHNSLAGAGLLFHEKWEIREMLGMGVLEEVLRRLGPYASADLQGIAHGRAMYEEHLFYQRVGEKLTGKKIPFPALKVVRDNLNMTGDPNMFYDFGEYNEMVKSQKFSEQDVRDAIELFEKTGWEFQDINYVFREFARLIPH